MNWIKVLCYCLFGPITWAQSPTVEKNQKADSLINLLAECSVQEDRMNLLGQISWAYLSPRAELGKGKAFADSLRSLATRLKDEKWLHRSHYYHGAYERFIGNHSEALRHLDTYLAYVSQTSDSNWVADGLFQKAAVLSKLGDYPRSLSLFYRLINIDKALHKNVNVANSLNSIGIIFFETQKYPEALQAYGEALEIYDSTGSEIQQAMVHCNVGNVYTKTGDFSQAMQRYQMALELNQKNGVMYGVALDLANIAYLFDAMKQYDSALIYHLKGLSIREQLAGKDDLARSLIGVGLGYKAVGDYRMARNYLQRALELTRSIESKPMIRDIYMILSEMYGQSKDFERAYHYMALHKKVNDSILSEESSKQINELKTRYETESKNQQIAILEKENEVREKEKQRQKVLNKAYAGGLAGALALAAVLFYIFRQRLRNQQILAVKNEEVREANFRQQLSELELKALRAQINPHFLFNCMNSINRLILEGNTDNASRYLTKFSVLVRQILENSETDQVALSSELDMLKSYIELEELRLKEKINCSVIIDEAIEPDLTFLPSMILQPFVENAIWHGLMHREQKVSGNIRIHIREKDDQLWCTIEDNGVGREKARLLRESSVWKSKSMGMKITEERLRFLSKEKLQELIRITDLKDPAENPLGTRVDIQIPIAE